MEGVTLLQTNDEQVESMHSKLRKREEKFNLKVCFLIIDWHLRVENGKNLGHFKC